MQDLDPFDASVLSLLAKVPAGAGMEEEIQDLCGRLETDAGREIADAILAPDPSQANVSADAKATAAYLKRVGGAS